MYFSPATFALIPNQLLCQKDISPDEKLVFAVLAQHCGNKLCCWPPLEKLAGEVGFDIGIVQMCLQRLHQLGLIKRHQISCLKKLQQRGVIRREPPSIVNGLLNAEYIYELTFIDWLVANKEVKSGGEKCL